MTLLSLTSALGAAALAALVVVLAQPLRRRQLRVFTMAACVLVDYKVTKWWRAMLADRRAQGRAKARAKGGLPPPSEEEEAKEKAWQEAEDNRVWARVHDRNADRVYSAIVALEGFWVKAGQYLSTRSDVMPDAYITRFKLLQDRLPARPLHEVLAAVKHDLGGVVDDLFRSFNTIALGTASIAQVHRAVTLDGEEVVVKVQHKGVKDRILQDLSNLRVIVAWVAWLEPDYNFSPVVEEWAKEVPSELDFRIEAQNLREVASNLCGEDHTGDRIRECPRCEKDAPWIPQEQGEGSAEREGACACGYVFGGARGRFQVDVELPRVLQATEKVLVMTFVDGIRLNDNAELDRFGVDKQRLVESITRAYAHQIYVDGLFNADPHPGNFLVNKEYPHKAVLLDFGLCKRIDNNMREALAKMLLATAKADAAMLLSAFDQMGLKLRTDIPDDAMSVTSFFFRRAAPAQESQAETQQHISEMQAKQKQKQEQEEAAKEAGEEKPKPMRRNPVDAFPGELVFFIRVLNLLRGLSSGLGARVAYLDIMRPFAEAVLSSQKRPAESPSTWFRSSPSSLEPLRSSLQKLLWGYHQQGEVLGMQVTRQHRVQDTRWESGEGGVIDQRSNIRG